MFLILGVSLVSTPGLEQAVLLVLEMEPLFIFISIFLSQAASVSCFSAPPL